MRIDTAFDFRSDTPQDGDPDRDSPRLRKFHRLLWSKALPSGAQFTLDQTTYGAYLHHHSELGEFVVSSDTMTSTFIHWYRLAPIIRQFSDSENEAFRHTAYTIGGMIIWPSNRIERKPTINGARGLTLKIADRMDLTLECIRRHYDGGCSPLSEVLDRYAGYFALFGSFRGFVDFFLLQDLVDEDFSVRFFVPFSNFETPAVPADVEAYREYRRRSMEFVDARNRRIGDLTFDEAPGT